MTGGHVDLAQAFDPIAAFRLDGKVVLLTGSSSGLGARFARVLDRCGARLVLTARRLELLNDVAAQCREAVTVECDLLDPSAADTVVGRAIDRFGRIDILINNAGAAVAKPALREGLDDVERMIGVDLLAPFRLAVAVARRMRECGGGVIVNVASIVAMGGTARLPMSGYAAAKGGLISLTRELATQWARYDIRVNALAPGWFESGMGQWVADDPDFLAWIEDRILTHRLGRSDELDGALLFLASDASSYVTGQTLVVDGGWTAAH
ncbi:hypothetical protein A5653_01950 [Mycobacterium colombiense]|uniref:SDR family NAD(P)-dependent oxidoreductase n=1 Tax=Mycobacterium colombiense TaxID=339268 RepID=UPI0007EFE60E|nr:SDR family oxidoreductase [Mycobacterium colombiense]OBK68944.1 hypothetical protein A5653_01950 [Mycobacterium colombiense]